jgi:hypothetical protein
MLCERISKLGSTNFHPVLEICNILCSLTSLYFRASPLTSVGLVPTKYVYISTGQNRSIQNKITVEICKPFYHYKLIFKNTGDRLTNSIILILMISLIDGQETQRV